MTHIRIKLNKLGRHPLFPEQRLSSTEQLVASLEAEIGGPLPDDYRRFQSQ